VTAAPAQQSQIIPFPAAPVGGLLAERDAQGWKAPSHPDPTTADAYLRLTAHLLLQTERQTCRSVGVTSAHQGEGKTTAAMNLAVCLGRTRGRRGRVLLVDADARQRTLTRLLGGAAVGDAGLGDGAAAQRHPMLLSTSFDGVDLMTAPDPKDALALYAPGVWRATLLELATRYEHVVIDCPSVLDHPAGMVLRDCVDALVLVVQSGRTPKRDVERALAGASRRVLGVVLNGAEGRALENWA
jgi:Mrp family chromosome partitioning ATPase